jgi:thymidylate synthase (FAD)
VRVELLAITPDPEKLIEQAGRTCYMSHDRATADSSEKFVRMLVSKGHLSVLEHASAAFKISGISRVSTHQIVRHRLCSFSQRSQRYVRENAEDFIVPPAISASPQASAVFEQAMSRAADAYGDLLKLGIPMEDARFVMPNATPSEIVLSANFRQLRHIIITRGSKHAQWEVRNVAIGILSIIKQHAPNVFADLDVCPDGYVEAEALAQ